MAYSTSTSSFGLGEFYGTIHRDRAVPGFRLVRLTADPIRPVGPHTHETAHFVLPLRGPYLSSAKGAPAVCDARVAIYNPPETSHRDRFESVDGTIAGQFFTVSVAPDRIREIGAEVPLADRPTALSGPVAIGLIRRLVDECERWTPASRLAVEGLCLELLGEVVRRTTAKAGDPPGWLLAAERLIEERFGERLSIGQLAEMVGVHPVHLARGFRRWRQATPADLVRRHRLERADFLLRTTDLPLVAVALQSGFSDQSHFTRSFSASRRLSPKRYRVRWAESRRTGPTPR